MNARNLCVFSSDGVFGNHTSAVGTCPPTSGYQRLIEISREVDRRRGVDSDVGAKLHTLLSEAGCEEPEIAIYQPAFLRGQPKEFRKI